MPPTSRATTISTGRKSASAARSKKSRSNAGRRVLAASGCSTEGVLETRPRSALFQLERADQRTLTSAHTPSTATITKGTATHHGNWNPMPANMNCLRSAESTTTGGTVSV